MDEECPPKRPKDHHDDDEDDDEEFFRWVQKKVPDKITENVYLGSMSAAQNLEACSSLGITHILLVAKMEPFYPTKFVYKCIEVADDETEEIDKYFDECFEFIENAIEEQGKVLIHCMSGVSRSPTIVMAYLLQKWKKPLTEIIPFVEASRPVVGPNEGFMEKLQALEARVLNTKV